MKRKLFILPILFVVFGTFHIFAQKEFQPQALLRLNDGPTHSDLKFFSIDLYMPESIEKPEYLFYTKGPSKCFDSKGTEIECTGANVAKCKTKDNEFVSCSAPSIASLFNGKKTLNQYKVELSYKDSFLASDRRGRLFSILLPKDFPVDKPPQVIFERYKTDNGELVFPSQKVGTDHNISFEYDSYNRILRQKITYSTNPISCGDPADEDNDADKAFAEKCILDQGSLKTSHQAYLKTRIADIRKWAKSYPRSNIKLRTEDLTKCIKINARGCITFDEWQRFVEVQHWPKSTGNIQEDIDANNRFFKELHMSPPPVSNPVKDSEIGPFMAYLLRFRNEPRSTFLKDHQIKIEDIDPTPIKNISVFSEDVSDMAGTTRILIDYMAKDSLPAKFSSDLRYEALAGNAPLPIPFELSKTFTVTAQEITQVAINVAEDTKTPGQRDRPNRLDLGYQFGSSVDLKEETVNNTIVKIPKRTTRGTLDVRVSPFSPIDNREGWFSWEPAFLDAKISNGKIDKDTLSLNRVVIGTNFDLTRFIETKGGVSSNPTYLNLSIKPVQASDRDFKQLEYKVITEFQPRLAFLNRIPANRRNTVNRLILRTDENETTRLIEPAFGYKFQPLLGGEIGKTWLRRRPASVIEPTDYIKRMYAGLDMTFYLPHTISLSILDKYYWNFGKTKAGKPVDGRENYFKISLDIGVRKTQGFGDSVFISFEKGNQPPFGARDTNAFKIGYRFVNPKHLAIW